MSAAFKAFSRNAPEGMIRVHDLREALRTYMHAEISDSQVEELLQHYKECFVSSPDSNWEFFKCPKIARHEHFQAAFGSDRSAMKCSKWAGTKATLSSCRRWQTDPAERPCHCLTAAK